MSDDKDPFIELTSTLAGGGATVTFEVTNPEADDDDRQAETQVAWFEAMTSLVGA